MELTISNPSKILGHLASNSDRVEISLLSSEFLKVDGGMLGLQIVCQKGKLWITQFNDKNDYILRVGERFVVTKPGLILVQSFNESLVQVIQPIK